MTSVPPAKMLWINPRLRDAVIPNYRTDRGAWPDGSMYRLMVGYSSTDISTI